MKRQEWKRWKRTKNKKKQKGSWQNNTKDSPEEKDLKSVVKALSILLPRP